MKKRERAIQVADLVAVAHFNEELVIFIDSEEGYALTSLSVLANFETQEFGPIQPLSYYLEMRSFEAIKDIDAQISYRHRITDEMSSEVISTMLSDFSSEYFLKYENLSVPESYNPTWELNEGTNSK